MSYRREFCKVLRSLPLWQQIGFWIFNVGGVSYGSVLPFLEMYRGVRIAWLYLLWISLLTFSVSTVLLVGKKVWEQADAARRSLAERLNPRLEVVLSLCCVETLSGIHVRRRLRIGTSNVSTVTIHNVRVFVTVTPPFIPLQESATLLPAIELRQAGTVHGSANAPIVLEGATLAPTGIDHHHWEFLAQHASGLTCIHPANEPFPLTVSVGPFREGVVIVEGEDSSPARLKFKLTTDDDSVIHITPCD